GEQHDGSGGHAARYGPRRARGKKAARRSTSARVVPGALEVGDRRGGAGGPELAVEVAPALARALEARPLDEAAIAAALEDARGEQHARTVAVLLHVVHDERAVAQH